MTSRSYKYFRDKKIKPLIFSRPVDRQTNFKRLWEETLSQSIDYKPSNDSGYDGVKLRHIIDDGYPAMW